MAVNLANHNSASAVIYVRFSVVQLSSYMDDECTDMWICSRVDV